MTKHKTAGSIPWPKLVSGTLIKRYKRFLVDVALYNDRTVTAHCPNSGSMKACCDPGRTVYLSYHDNPKRKLKYTWELIHMPDSLVGVNTLVPNRLVFKAIEAGKIKTLNGYDTIKREVTTSKGSRIDLMLDSENKDRCYVEVKNCTFVEGGEACFPDAKTSRGLKHLVELQRLIRSGSRCVMFYLIQRMDAKRFSPADDIDPDYGNGLREAVKAGVEILVYDVEVNLKHIRLNKEIPYSL